MRSVDGGYGVRVRSGMEGAAIDALARVDASLQRGDTVNLNVSDVWAGLTLAKVVHVLDEIMTGV
jgi:hypothetical protein